MANNGDYGERIAALEEAVETLKKQADGNEESHLQLKKDMVDNQRSIDKVEGNMEKVLKLLEEKKQGKVTAFNIIMAVFMAVIGLAEVLQALPK